MSQSQYQQQQAMPQPQYQQQQAMSQSQYPQYQQYQQPQPPQQQYNSYQPQFPQQQSFQSQPPNSNPQWDQPQPPQQQWGQQQSFQPQPQIPQQQWGQQQPQIPQQQWGQQQPRQWDNQQYQQQQQQWDNQQQQQQWGQQQQQWDNQQQQQQQTYQYSNTQQNYSYQPQDQPPQQQQQTYQYSNTQQNYSYQPQDQPPQRQQQTYQYSNTQQNYSYQPQDQPPQQQQQNYSYQPQDQPPQQPYEQQKPYQQQQQQQQQQQNQQQTQNQQPQREDYPGPEKGDGHMNSRKSIKMSQCRCSSCSKLTPRSQQSYAELIVPPPFHLGRPFITNKKIDCAEIQNVCSCKHKPAMYALIGMALGDSLGIPFENCKPEEATYYWKENGQYPEEMITLGAIWTDDTQQSLSVMEAFMHPNYHTGKTPELRALLNRDEVLEIWKRLSSKDVATGSKVEYGGFRGTGSNFRSTMEAPSDDVRSTYTAGNGVVMKVVPFAIAAHDTELGCDRNIEIKVLSKNIIEVAKITTHNLLAVTPAYSVAYLIYRCTAHDRDEYLSRGTKDILESIYNYTYQFEETIGTDKFFMRNPWDNDIVHFYSGVLRRVIDKINTSTHRDPDSFINEMAEFVPRCANEITERQLVSLNDGMGITTALSAILFALLYKDKPFLSVLQAMYYYGGDTDSVGAVLGGLLGAIKGEITPDITTTLIEYEALTEIFKRFIEHVFNGSQSDGGPKSVTWPCAVGDDYKGFVELEDKINGIIRSADKRNVTVRDKKNAKR